MIGLLRRDRKSVSAPELPIGQVFGRPPVLRPALFLALVFYLRQVYTAGSPQAICISKLGVRSSSFFYAGRLSLVRFLFRGKPYDRNRLDPLPRFSSQEHRHGWAAWAKPIAASGAPGARP